MASGCSGMDPEDERRLIRNWTFLKNELMVDKFLQEFIDSKIFSENTLREIKNVQPNTRLMRADKFLHSLIKSGYTAYEKLCEILRRDSNRYKEVLTVLQIEERPETGTADEATENNRPNSNISSQSGSSKESEKKNGASNIGARSSTPNRTHGITPPSTRITAPVIDTSSMSPHQISLAQMTQAAANVITTTGTDKNSGIDVDAVEKSLVQIAPAIAQLIQNISSTINNNPEGLEEYKKVKNENETLRKTNRALVEQLNSFQQKIIQLQLENKRLRDTGQGTKELKDNLEKKSADLETLRKKLEEQKTQLEEKEVELNIQLDKIKQIEEENENFKLQIMKLQVLHDDGVAERKAQQEQIQELREVKERQQDHIELLEDIQQQDEEAMVMLEERLTYLEQYGTPRYQTAHHQKSTTRSRRNTRVVSPPRTMPWMNGMVSRSHHANVKFLPPTPHETKKEKGWSF